MKKIILMVMASSSLLFSGGINWSSFGFSNIGSFDVMKYIPERMKNSDNYFVEGSLGVALTSVKNDVKTAVMNDSSTSEMGVGINIGAGCNVTDNIFVTMNYERLNIDIYSLDNVYISANYLFDESLSGFLKEKAFPKYIIDSNISPYVGVLTGYSSASWEEQPVKGVLESQETSKNLFFGLQAGVEGDLDEDIKFFTSLKYNFVNHKTLVNGEEFSHNNHYSIMAGFKFSL